MNYEAYKESVRKNNDIVEVIEQSGVTLQRSGKCLQGLCAFHNDKNTPSLTVYPDTQSWYCFGCNRGGDVFDFVMMDRNCDFEEAINELARKVGMSPAKLSKTQKQAFEKKRVKQEILTAAAEFYVQNMPQNVREYLKKDRGLTEDIINANKLGYAPSLKGKNANTPSLLEYLEEKGYTKSQAVDAGVLYANGKEYFSECIIFPNWLYGKVIYITGRGYPEKSHKKPFRNKIPLNNLFFEEALRKKEVVAAEGEIETLSLRQAGFNACGILGASSFKKEWADKFKNAERVYISFDGDGPGIKAAIEIGNLLGDKARIVCFPDFTGNNGIKAKDWNELFTQKHHCDIETFKAEYQQCLDNSQTVLEFKIKQIPQNTPARDLNSFLSPIFTEIQLLSGIQQDFYTDVIIDHFKDFHVISREAIKADIKKAGDTSSKTARSGYQKSESEPEHLTDLGNTRRLVSLHGDDLLYCHPWRQWFVWDGVRWVPDDTGETERKAKDTVKAIYAEATQLLDDSERKRLAKHAIRSESASNLKAMISSAESESGIPARPEELDADSWKLNVVNGTIDLKTGELCPHSREDLITKLAPVEYDPVTEAPSWKSFLDRIMAGNQDLIGFIQRAAGYALTGDTREQVIFILHGPGANGKSTFLEVLSAATGDYARQTPTDTLLIKRSEGIPNDIARLKGARLVSAVEPEQGRRLAESVVKQITGGDKLTARFLRREFFEFVPTFKVFLGTNHKPEIRGTDNAIWRRIRLIPFMVTIPESEQDKTLIHKLKNELPGILNWAIKGCLLWQKYGLGESQEVKNATEKYRAESDIIGEFLEVRTISKDGARVRASDLYEAYREWCQENDEEIITRTAFGRRLTERGIDKEKDRNGWLYIDIGLFGKDSR